MNTFFYWSGVIAWLWIVGTYLVWPIAAAISIVMIEVYASVRNFGWSSVKWLHVPAAVYVQWKDILLTAIPHTVSSDGYWVWRGVFRWEIKRAAMREKGGE